jgi:putative ABC transport system substrate-binding protein
MSFDRLKRREFISLLGGAAAAWPLAVRAQEGERVRRVGVLMVIAADDPEVTRRLAGFQQTLQELGWNDGGNLRLDYRWGPNLPDRVRRDASELLGLAPNVVVASSGAASAAFQQLSRTVPIVFVGIIDAVAGGRVASLAQPGGNATGFISVEYGMSGKLLELLKEIAPRTKRAAVVRDPTTPGGAGQYGAIQAVAPSFGVELSPIDLRDPGEIERGIAAFGQAPNGGLIVPASALATFQRETIITATARHRLPAVYSGRQFVASAGLISYAPAQSELWRGAAGYVDRILRGAKPADLPVQTPTKYELLINLKTAKALNLEISPSVLARADEVIE